MRYLLIIQLIILIKSIETNESVNNLIEKLMSQENNKPQIIDSLNNNTHLIEFFNKTAQKNVIYIC